VEVMACPSGCVNGGGQMKPVSFTAKRSVAVDEEGYERPVADEGVEVPGQVDEGMRWSTKDWVAKVEDIYWNGLPTPPPSPKPAMSSLSNGNGQGHGEREGEGDVEMNGVDVGKSHENDRLRLADRIAESVVHDVCGDNDGMRWEFLRTRFRKVEGDVLGGGVSHDAVKW